MSYIALTYGNGSYEIYEVVSSLPLVARWSAEVPGIIWYSTWDLVLIAFPEATEEEVIRNCGWQR
jgi:hypothetical protein